MLSKFNLYNIVYARFEEFATFQKKIILFNKIIFSFSLVHFIFSIIFGKFFRFFIFSLNKIDTKYLNVENKLL